MLAEITGGETSGILLVMFENVSPSGEFTDWLGGQACKPRSQP